MNEYSLNLCQNESKINDNYYTISNPSPKIIYTFVKNKTYVQN
jgi:hypothetical protein